jgi:hypothetical protein
MAIWAAKVPFGSEANGAKRASWNPVVIELFLAFRTSES